MPSSPRDCKKLIKENTRLRGEIADIRKRLADNGETRSCAAAEERLNEIETRFRHLADSAPVMIGMTDVHGNITYINKQWLDFTGSSDADNAGFKWISLLHPDDRSRVESEITDAVHQQQPYAVQYRLRRTDGVYRWILDKAVPRYTTAKNFVGYVGTAMDITELIEAREEKRKLEQKIQHAQKLESLGVLAGGVAHDFNNLLTGILGNASLALQKLDSASPARENVALIERAGLQASEMTRQLLAFSGRGRFIVEPLNLSSIIEDTAKLLHLSISQKAVLVLRLTRPLPAIEADAAQIRQILMNLVINASDALMEQPGTISVITGVARCDSDCFKNMHVHQELRAGPYVYLEVCDTGCGMDKETLSKIFDPFFTTKFAGRGLGLAAILGIVRGHKGAIKIDSEPGRGSSFRVLFPASMQPALAQVKPIGEEACEHWRARGVALLVDDEEVVRRVASEMLQRAGFTVLTAENGNAALEIFREKRREISLVLLDLTMPGMSGEEVFRKMQVTCEDVKVILSSGYDEQDTLTRFGKKGFAGFLHKPFTFGQLMEVIKRVGPGDFASVA